MAAADSKVKLVVLGIGAVGKSSLSVRFINNTFSGEYDPTIMNNYTKVATVDNKVYTFDILDTAGMDTNEAARPTIYGKRDAFILVYAINDQNSFSEIDRIYNDVLRVLDRSSVPCVLCGNKCDLASEREVTEEEGRELARRINAYFLETSARDGTNVEEAIFQAVREYLKTCKPAVAVEQKQSHGCFGRRSKR